MSDSEFEVIERTDTKMGRRRIVSAFYDALMHTATTGQALRVALNGDRASAVRNRLVSYARYRGYRLHCGRSGPSHVEVWVEKKK
jgi:hypothetical protein